MGLLSKFFVLVAAVEFTLVSGGTLRTVSSWTDNPSNLPAALAYVPDKIATRPAIVLGLHPCGGSGQQYYQSTNIPSYADSLGFIALYPTSNQQSGFNCWDAHSSKTLTHNGGGDSQGLAGLVKWALQTYNGDASKVFIVGGSSGAMEANVLAATYPDVFAAAASYAGVPAACWAGSPSSTPLSSDLSCPQGQKAATYTAARWADLARGCYPGYSGARTRMMILHGTADALVSPNNLNAQLAQWSTVMGLSFTRNATNTPTTNWTKMIYGDGTKLLGYELRNGGHIPPFLGDETMKFFGLI